MKIDINYEKNNATIYLDDGFKLILTINEIQELKEKLLEECEE